LIAFRLLSAISEMRNGCVVLRERCVEGITANPDRLRYFVEQSIGVVTALVPAIGYERATQVAKEALDSGRGVYDIVLEKGLLTQEELDRLLDPEAMTGDGGGGGKSRPGTRTP
jgi:aspartate ammonia-lyase